MLPQAPLASERLNRIFLWNIACIKMAALKIQLLCALFLVVVFPSNVFAVDFRSWSWASAQNSRLLGHVNEIKMTSSLLSCLSECGMMPGCRTVNHNKQDGTCEINAADARWNGIASPKPDPNFTYYQKIIPAGLQDVDTAHLDKPCHEDHVLLDNTCLEIVPEGKLNYSAALEACNHNYGRLAVLDTPALWGVLDMLEPFGVLKRYYLDIVRSSEDDLVWGTTGSLVPLTTPPWKTGEPSGYQGGLAPVDCARIEGYAININPDYEFGFVDVPCNLVDGGYICQYDPWVYLVW